MAENGKEENSAPVVQHKHDDYCTTWRTDLRLSRGLCLIMDCKVLAKNKTFRAHRAFLKARSPVMASMLDETPDELDLRAFDQEVVNTLLEYVYTGEVRSLKIGSACDVYEAGLLFGLPLLQRHCVRFMRDNVTVPLFPRVARLAQKHGEKKLLSRLEMFCAQHLMELVKSEEWIKLLGSDSRLANELLMAALEINEVRG